MARTSSAASQALTFLEILLRIPQSRYVTVREIQCSLAASDISVETLTLQRSLKEMSENPAFGVIRNYRSKPYGYRRQKTQLALKGLSAEESLLLRLVQEHLTYQMPSNLNTALKPLFDAAKVKLNEDAKSSKERQWLKKVAVVPNTLHFQAPKILPRIFSTVSDALFQNLKLSVLYRNVSNEKKTAVVSPLGLVQQDVRIYLVCRFDGYYNIRHLALHRIENAELNYTPCERPVDFSLDKYLQQHPFNYNWSTKGEVLLTFETTNLATVSNLRETPMNSTQKIEELGEGRWKYSVKVEDSLLLDGWLNTWQETAGIENIVKTPL